LYFRASKSAALTASDVLPEREMTTACRSRSSSRASCGNSSSSEAGRARAADPVRASSKPQRLRKIEACAATYEKPRLARARALHADWNAAFSTSHGAGTPDLRLRKNLGECVRIASDRTETGIMPSLNGANPEWMGFTLTDNLLVILDPCNALESVIRDSVHDLTPAFRP